MVTQTLTSTDGEKDNIGFIILVSMVATIGGFLFGFDSGVINGTVDGLVKAFNASDIGTGFNVASMLLGCAIGAFFAGQLADRFGRKTILMITAILFIISAFGSGIADSSAQFILFRVIGGLAVGGASVISPAYISEIAPAKYRGALTTIQQVAIISGLFTAFISNYLLADLAGGSTEVMWLSSEAWRWMFWMELIPATLFFILLFFIPESPRFLVINKREQEAKLVLAKLYSEAKVEHKLNDISQSLTPDRHQPKLTDLLSSQKRLKPIVWIGIGLAAFQQLVGINVVFYYGAVLWQAVGFSESDALLINIISGGVSILACIITIYFIDKWGRKPFLLIGSIGMTITLAILVYVFANSTVDPQGHLDIGDFGTLALVSANAYVFFFNLSWGPVMWVLLGEMFPNQMRGSALAVSGLAQWLTNFMITMTFPIMLAGLGLAFAYSVYTAFALISIFFVYYFVRETKGKELEQMTE